MTVTQTRIITKHMHESDDAHNIDTYISLGGYEIAKRAIRMKPEDIIEKHFHEKQS